MSRGEGIVPSLAESQDLTERENKMTKSTKSQSNKETRSVL